MCRRDVGLKVLQEQTSDGVTSLETSEVWQKTSGEWLAQHSPETRQVILDDAYVKTLADAKKPLTDFITSILPCYLDFYHTQCGRNDMDVHDLSAMVYAVAPDLFTAEEWYVEVGTMGRCAGQTVVDYLGSWGQDPNVEVCVGVDAASLLDLFYERMIA